MTHQPLPERPNLAQLKTQAKDLLRAARHHEPAALARLRTLPALAGRNDEELARTTFALHDAQSVIAREHGFPSWNDLRERVEELTLQFAEAVDEFVRAATDGRGGRARRLLTLHPAIARADLQTALVLGDAATVRHRLQQDPTLAIRPGGVRDWEPLLYVCHTAMHRTGDASADGLVAIVRHLLALGADANTRFPWRHHGVRRAVLWGAVFATGSLELAKVLLEAGANPNDGVTLPIAASAGADGIDALELLHAHGADVNQPWATDGTSALHAVLGWTSGIAGVRWLLEHGARVNDVFGPLAETALHVAARRCGADMIDLLVRHGAVIDARRADGRTAYALAAKSGNRAAAEALVRHGADPTLAEADRFVAACAAGDRATADALVARRPELRAQGAEALQEVLRAAAERGDLPTLALALDYGAGPDATDEMGRTALHCAAMAGWPDVARALLERGASVTARDAEFHAQPLIWAAEGSRSVGSDGGKRDHATVGRLLLAAGSPVDWSPGDEPSAAIVEIVESWSQGG